MSNLHNEQTRIVKAYYLGLVDYMYAFQLQRDLVEARVSRNISDVLLLLQHPHIYTIGRFRGQCDVLVSQEMLIKNDIQLVYTNRGGSVTYHGPGQLVGYPILDLKENHIGIRDYVWMLEEVIIRTLAKLDITAQRNDKHRGVWLDGKQVCSIGIAVTRYVTMHGFAINVSPDLGYFKYINPCGMTSDEITSIAVSTGKVFTMKSLLEKIVLVFSEVFKSSCEMDEVECLLHGVQTG